MVLKMVHLHPLVVSLSNHEDSPFDGLRMSGFYIDLCN